MAILVVGISFAGTQWFWANHMDSNLVDIAAGVASLIATTLFYYDVRIRREGFDLEFMAGRMEGGK